MLLKWYEPKSFLVVYLIEVTSRCFVLLFACLLLLFVVVVLCFVLFSCEVFFFFLYFHGGFGFVLGFFWSTFVFYYNTHILLSLT